MALSIADFAARIKAKYPDYASVPDADLVSKIVLKYPAYADQVEGTVATKAAQNEAGIAAGRDVPAGALDPTDKGGFWQGVKDEAVPSLSGLANLVMHPIDSNVAAYKGMYQGAKREAGQTVDAIKRGDVMEAGGHALATALPVIGPAAASAAEEIKGGDIMHGLGRGTGLVLQAVAPELAARGMSKVVGAAPAIDAAAKERYAAQIDPTGINPDAAGSLASDQIAAGKTMRNPQKELPQLLEDKIQGVDTQAPILGRSSAARAKPITDAIKRARNDMYNEKLTIPEPDNPRFASSLIEKLKAKNPGAEVFSNGQGEIVVRVIRHPSMQSSVDALHALEQHVNTTANRGMIPNDTLANLHSDYNYYGNEESGQFAGRNTPSERLPPSATVAKAVQDVVNSDQASAAANAEKSSWIKAKRQLPQNAPTDTLPTKTDIAMSVGGAVAGIVIPAGKPLFRLALAAGGVGSVGRLIYKVYTSPYWQTATALKQAAFAKALQAGDWAQSARIGTGIVSGMDVAQNNQ